MGVRTIVRTVKGLVDLIKQLRWWGPKAAKGLSPARKAFQKKFAREAAKRGVAKELGIHAGKAGITITAQAIAGLGGLGTMALVWALHDTKASIERTVDELGNDILQREKKMQEGRAGDDPNREYELRQLLAEMEELKAMQDALDKVIARLEKEGIAGLDWPEGEKAIRERARRDGPNLWARIRVEDRPFADEVYNRAETVAVARKSALDWAALTEAERQDLIMPGVYEQLLPYEVAKEAAETVMWEALEALKARRSTNEEMQAALRELGRLRAEQEKAAQPGAKGQHGSPSTPGKTPSRTEGA